MSRKSIAFFIDPFDELKVPVSVVSDAVKFLTQDEACDLKLVYVCDTSPRYSFTPEDDKVDKTLGYARDAVDAVKADLSLPNIETVVLKNNSGAGSEAAYAAQKFIEEADPNFIISLSHGKSSFQRKILGSFTDNLLRQSRVPCLILNPEVTSLSGAAEKAYVPLSLSESSQSFLNDLCDDRRLLIFKELELVSFIETSSLKGPNIYGYPFDRNSDEYIEDQTQRFVKMCQDTGVESFFKCEMISKKTDAATSTAKNQKSCSTANYIEQRVFFVNF